MFFKTEQVQLKLGESTSQCHTLQIRLTSFAFLNTAVCIIEHCVCREQEGFIFGVCNFRPQVSIETPNPLSVHSRQVCSESSRSLPTVIEPTFTSVLEPEPAKSAVGSRGDPNRTNKDSLRSELGNQLLHDEYKVQAVRSRH